MNLGKLSWIALVAGMGAVVEMIFVLPIQQFGLNHSLALVLQSIAMVAQGQAAFRGGAASVALGVGIHILVSVVAAGIYAGAALRWNALVRQPFVGGVVFGALVYVVMIFVVIPLSAIGFSPPRSLGLFALSFAIHLFAFGLPIALDRAGDDGRPSADPVAVDAPAILLASHHNRLHGRGLVGEDGPEADLVINPVRRAR
ncbi:MAG TPA: hypothetical protein VGF71_07670 [Caulobacteraceae bacterium]|jgi:hypothetical protein